MRFYFDHIGWIRDHFSLHASCIFAWDAMRCFGSRSYDITEVLTTAMHDDLPNELNLFQGCFSVLMLVTNYVRVFFFAVMRSAVRVLFAENLG